MSTFSDCWRSLEASGPPPSRCRKLVRRDWSGFRERVLRGDAAFVRALCESLYAGDCYVLSGAFERRWMEALRRKTMAWMRERPSQFFKMLEGAPDFHKIIDAEEGMKYSFRLCKHAAYFFPWNDDPLDVLPEIYERWRVLKVMMGLEANEYEENTPKEGVVDRVQVVRYPAEIGFLEPHSDPYLHQRLFISGYVSKRGVDYQGGGFYLVGREDSVVEAEDEIEIGDIGIGYATVYHGVAPCQGEPRWDDDSGRWFLGLYSNVSDEVADRHTGSAARLDIKGVMP